MFSINLFIFVRLPFLKALHGGYSDFTDSMI